MPFQRWAALHIAERVAADGKSSDGVGIMTQVPRNFLLRRRGLTLKKRSHPRRRRLFFPAAAIPRLHKDALRKHSRRTAVDCWPGVRFPRAPSIWASRRWPLRRVSCRR